MQAFGQHRVNPPLQDCSTNGGLVTRRFSNCVHSAIWLAQGSGVDIGQKFVGVVAVFMSVDVVIVVVVVVIICVVMVISVVGLPQYPPNGFKKPKFHVKPPNLKGLI